MTLFEFVFNCCFSEEAAVSTGAWISSAVGASGGPGQKRKAIPDWLRDELERIEKKKARDAATEVEGDGKGQFHFVVKTLVDCLGYENENMQLNYDFH